MLDKGCELEDACKWGAALNCYQQALAQEPENHDLRAHIGLLTRRVNALATFDKMQQRHDTLIHQLVCVTPVCNQMG